MTLTYFNDLNVYFHMRNHFRLLKNVKSVVDTSLPESLLKSPMATSSVDLKSMKGAANEHLRRVYNTNSQGSTTAQKKRGSVKKHNCLNSVAQSEVCLSSNKSTSRPAARRNISSTPQSHIRIDHLGASSKLSSIAPPQPEADNMLKFFQRKRPLRSRRDGSTSRTNPEPQNSIPASRRGSEPNSSRPTTTLGSPMGSVVEGSAERQCAQEGSIQGDQNSNDNNRHCFVLQDNEEHEYLLFLLRITEDIISQDFYSNGDIRKIFKSHVDLNKNRLNQRKMYQHINNLCKELNIDCKDYEAPDTSLATIQQRLHTPRKHRNVFNNEAFKNCRDCSSLRSSSFNQLHDAIEEYRTMSDKSIRDSTTFSPSLMKLLEKLSLGRVTECTESVSSCTPATSRGVMQSPERDLNCDKAPVDFDTFVKELKAHEVTKEEINKAVLSPTILPTKPEALPSELKLDSLKLDTPKPPEEPDQKAPKTPSSDSKTDLSLKEGASSCTVSEKYESESEFEKCSSSENPESNESPVKKDSSKVDNGATIVPLLELNHDDKECESESSKNSTARQVIVESEKVVDLVSSAKCDEEVTAISAKNENLEKSLDETDTSKMKPKSPEHCSTPVISTINVTPSDSPLKIILRNKIREEDYVMIKGPVYIYKPLLETEPKLVIFPEAQHNQPSPPVSERSHRTFTVDHPAECQSVDEGVQYDTSLHSIHVNHTLENILELTRRAYTQFNDLKLLEGDYDMTPEKDEPDAEKYHNLLVDVETSVSGHNLLMSDDYVTNRVKTEDLKVELGKGDTIDEYVRFEQRLLDGNYVINNRSASVPRLRLNSGKLLSNSNFSEKREVLSRVSSDLIKFDDLSQEGSSIRSEGEAPIVESSRSDLHWDVFNMY